MGFLFNYMGIFEGMMYNEIYIYIYVCIYLS